MKKFFKYVFIVIGVIIVIFLFLVFFPLSNITFKEKDYLQILIEDVNIVDIENEKIDSSQYILIEGNKIKRTASSPIKISDQKTLRINAKNKYVIPALWDMHVHLNRHFPKNVGAEFIVHGVMHVRDMRGAYKERDPFATTPKRIKNWNHQIENEKLIAPLIHNTPSLAIEGPHKMFDGLPDFFNCSNSDEAELLVDYFNGQGVDLIKTYNNIPRDAFFSLMQRAKEKGISVAGHKPARISTIEASNSGMRSLEHARFLIWDSYKYADSIRKLQDPKSMDKATFRHQLLKDHDSVTLDNILSTLYANNTFYCPTHLTRKADAYAMDENFRKRYDSINHVLQLISFEDLDATHAEDPSVFAKKIYFNFYKKGLEVTKKANDQDVQLLAGSDVPELPGSSLIDELEEFSRAGLSNYEVLKTAISNPAKYYNLQNQYARIKNGRVADLIILNKNPVEDISVIRDIHGLLYNGHYLDQKSIKKYKQKIYDRNTSYMMSAKLIWDVIIYSTL